MSHDPISVNQLWQFASRQHANLNKDAFTDIAKVYLDFIKAHQTGKSKSTHWVCDAAPGHGKTTALICVLKALSQQKQPTPLLIVFNNKDTMNDFCDEMGSFARSIENPDLIQSVDQENVKAVQETLRRYMYICITQQRLRDLALGFGDWSQYGTYQRDTQFDGLFADRSKPVSRAIVIDEMPIFFDECIFDIGKENNAVAWFDDITDHIQISDVDQRSCRNMIMNMITTQLLMNKSSVTTALKTYFEGSLVWKEFKKMYGKLNVEAEGISLESLRYRNWFNCLLDKDAIGCIDRSRTSEVILCSQYIDYKRLGNVLILDGTSQFTESVYNGYTFKTVKNRHDYANRLLVHWRVLNTNADKRKNGDSVQTTIAGDIATIRYLGINPFPIVMKADIAQYIANGVISEPHKKLYDGRDGGAQDETGRDQKITNSQRLALNLFNTTGKNDLREYESLALTSMPIRNAQYYKLKAIGLFGTNINISMSDSSGSWFQDKRVEKIYTDLAFAELVQIIHRSNLRDTNSSSPIHVYLYTSHESWILRLKTKLNLPEQKVEKIRLNNDSDYGFEDKCKEWALKAVEYFTQHEDPFNDLPPVRPSEIGGKQFREWLNDNWLKSGRRASITRIFSKYQLAVVVEGAGNYKYIKYTPSLDD